MDDEKTWDAKVEEQMAPVRDKVSTALSRAQALIERGGTAEERLEASRTLEAEMLEYKKAMEGVLGEMRAELLGSEARFDLLITRCMEADSTFCDEDVRSARLGGGSLVYGNVNETNEAAYLAYCALHAAFPVTHEEYEQLCLERRIW